MRILYLDNFRGFKNAFIIIRNINFFVGENSTGKTSVLSLIHLMSTPNFWFNLDFNISNVKLGYFDDIVSKFSDKRDYFTIGFCEQNKKLKDSFKSIVLKFINKEAIPKVTELRYIDENLDVKVIFSKKNLKYKIKDLRKLHDNVDFSENFFEKWINDFLNERFDESDKEIKSLKIDPRMNNDIFLIKNIIKGDYLSVKSEEQQLLSSAIPTLFNMLVSIAPIRTEPKSLYEGFRVDYSPEGQHIPFLLKRIFDKKSKSTKIQDFIKSFGIESGLFDSIEIKKYGKEKTSPFEIYIILNKLPFKISSVGYGISQILPILTDAIALSKGCWFLMQQPEIHLHPRAQASVGDLIYNLHQSDDKKFIVETHSDYIIDRFRLNQYKQKKPINAQVIFFERNEFGNQAHHIIIGDDAKYSEIQPKSFKEFFIKEQISLLDI